MKKTWLGIALLSMMSGAYIVKKYLISPQPKKIRVIVSANNDPMYIDFWPVVARVWKDLVGVTPTLALVAHADVRVDESLGDVIRINPIEGVPDGEVAKIVRLFLPAYFQEDICIVSDIDMIPMNKDFFIKPLEHCVQDKFVVYRDKAYPAQIRQIPMCYVAAKGKVFKDVFGIKSVADIEPLIKQWWQNYNYGYCTDEKNLYRCIHSWHNYATHCVKLGGYSIRRLDRGDWRYDENTIAQGMYDDCHMVRPYAQYKQTIDSVVEALFSQSTTIS